MAKPNSSGPANIINFYTKACKGWVFTGKVRVFSTPPMAEFETETGEKAWVIINIDDNQSFPVNAPSSAPLPTPPQ